MPLPTLGLGPVGKDLETAPVITIRADNLPEVCDGAEAALRETNAGVYERGDLLVRFITDDELAECDRPYRLVPLDDVALAQLVNRSAAVYREDRRNGELKRSNCPTAVARTILAERVYHFPGLRAIAECPTVLPSGQLLQDNGYHLASRILVHLRPNTFSPIDANPTKDDAAYALREMRDLNSGFQFEDATSESVALAMQMTALLRAGLESAPLFAASAHAPGSGKTYLQRLAPLLATGRDLAAITYPGEEVELQKLLFASLLGGEQIICVDNLNGVFSSDTLCSILTAPSYQARRLGVSENVTVPTAALFLVNGNNLILSGDLVRRTLVTWLDPKVERPHERRFSFDPLECVVKGRGLYVDALLTMCLAYLRAGAPLQNQLPRYGSFEQWARMVREPLVWLGLEDPVSSIVRAAELDPERQQLHAMLLAVRATFQGAEWTVPRLVAAARHARGDAAELGLEGLPGADPQLRSALREAVEAVAERNGEINKRVLGKWLASVCGRIGEGLRFDRVTARGREGVEWRVVVC
jgi:putative DNA primase/helicase